MTNPTIEQSARVPAGEDRFQQRREVLGSMSIDYKVSSSDTDGDHFIMENTNDFRGGPPRHLHHEQEEWFYVGEGTGRSIVTFQPAGEMEAFFGAMSRVKGAPSREELHGLFRSHGMELTGPPLPVE